MEKHALSHYGEIPVFKAGLHYGKVMVAEVYKKHAGTPFLNNIFPPLAYD